MSRHIFEVGAAAGLALGKLRICGSEMLDPWSQDLSKIAFSGRIHGAFDFYILPTFSVGVLIGYRYLKLDFPGSTYSAEFEGFRLGFGI